MKRSERTIYRWLNELTVDLHISVCVQNGGYYLDEPGRSDKLNLSPEELLAVRLALKSSIFAEGSPIHKLAASAWLKIREAAGVDTVECAVGLSSTHSVKVTAHPPETSPDIGETLQRAIKEHSRLRVTYRSQKSREIRKYLLDPLALVFRRHSWYLLAYCEEHGQVSQFKLARFLDAVETGMTFKPPLDFSVDDYFSLSWEAWAGGMPTYVKVRFSPKVADMIAETRRHPTQVVTPLPDGSVLFEVTVSGTEEIAIWILGYGKEAEVLEPAELRAYIREHAVAMVRAHSENKEKLYELRSN